jgi:transcriptional regulator of acetoin/glycerol metabolism
VAQPADGTRLRARDRFIGGAGLDPSVRPEIGASWRRSMLSGVPTDRLPDLPVDELDDENRLLRAAAPVLDRMADDIADVSMSLVLTDGAARILDRRVGVRRLRAALDRVSAVPGAAYSEDVVGTNGIGTCIETRRPVLIAGAEHFAEPLCRLTCAGAPIVHPFTGRLEGVLDVTAAADDTTGLMLAFVREAAAQIRAGLEELASATERALFDAFVAASRRTHRALLSVNGELVIANAAAARLLAPEDHAGVWGQVGDDLGDSGASEDVALAIGATLHADIVPITVGGRSVGALVRLDDGPRRRRRPAAAVLPGLVGTSGAWRTLVDEAIAVARSRLDVLVAGEDGTGKLAVARAIHAVGDQATAPCEVIDMASAAGTAWLDGLRTAVARPGTVVLRHLDQLPAAQTSAVAAACESAPAHLIATANASWISTSSRRLIDRFPAHLVVPALRERVDDLPAVARELVRRHGDGVVGVRGDVVGVLSRRPWPGNVRELEGVLRHALARRSRGDLTVDDLPVEYRSPVAPEDLTTMQTVEREAIVRALDAEDGNRWAAAERLGISRSTLYRKLATYHIA